MQLTRDRLDAELRFADSVLRADARVATAARFEVRHGRPGAQIVN